MPSLQSRGRRIQRTIRIIRTKHHEVNLRHFIEAAWLTLHMAYICTDLNVTCFCNDTCHIAHLLECKSALSSCVIAVMLQPHITTNVRQFPRCAAWRCSRINVTVIVLQKYVSLILVPIIYKTAGNLQFPHEGHPQ